MGPYLRKRQTGEPEWREMPSDAGSCSSITVSLATFVVIIFAVVVDLLILTV